MNRSRTLWLVAAALVALWSFPAVAQEGGGEASTPAAPPGPDPAQQQQAVQKLFDIMKKEPSIKEVQRATLRYYQLEPERIRGMSRAAHLKGLLPELEGSFDQNLGTNFSNMRDGFYPVLPAPESNPNAYKERTTGGQSGYTWRVRAVFSLDKLAFNAESLDVKSLNSMGESLVREATTLYFARRRLIASLLLSPPQSDEELFYELMRLDELTATLDALTGGTFGKRAWRWDDENKPK